MMMMMHVRGKSGFFPVAPLPPQMAFPTDANAADDDGHRDDGEKDDAQNSAQKGDRVFEIAKVVVVVLHHCRLSSLLSFILFAPGSLLSQRSIFFWHYPLSRRRNGCLIGCVCRLTSGTD